MFESAYIVTMGVGFNIIKEDIVDPELLRTINDFEKDPIIKEKIALFSEVFQLKN